MKNNAKGSGAKPTDLETSIFTLTSLYVLIDQNFQALLNHYKLLHKDSNLDNDDDISPDTIHEALTFQIILKTCAFLDEWDKIFGVKTCEEYSKQITRIKHIASPARRFIINTWKGLRDYRNQAIAHNHRDKDNNNIYYTRKAYYIPEGMGELALLIFCIEKMAVVLGAILPTETFNSVQKVHEPDLKYDYSNFRRFDKNDILEIVYQIDEEARMRFDPSNNYTFRSLYGDFIKTTPE